MDKLDFRIFDALCSNLGNDLSIHGSKELIQEKYGKATYKNIYDKIQGLAEKKILEIEKIGNSSIASLNFGNPLTFDLLSQTELIKKGKFLEDRPEMQSLLFEMENYFSKGFYFIESISLIRPEKNFKLNRAEFLFLLREPLPTGTGNKLDSEEGGEQGIQNEIESIYPIMQLLQDRHNLKSDFLILRENEFFELLKDSDSNPLKAMLSDRIAFYSPQNFWLSIHRAMNEGIRIKAEKGEWNAAKASEKDLFYNLNRFGYTEFGEKLEAGRNTCIESIIAFILVRGDARRQQAIPIILSKEFERNHRKPNYNLLVFQCQKCNKLPELLGLLKAFHEIKPLKKTGKAIKLLEGINISEKKANLKALKEKMRLYNAL